MAGPVARIVAQLVVMGVGIVSRAFVQAYQQAAANGGKAAATAAVKKAAGALTAKEARQILNLGTEEKLAEEAVLGQFQKLFELNDPEKGGSLYLQSKIFNAKDSLLEEIRAEQAFKPDNGPQRQIESEEEETQESKKK